MKKLMAIAFAIILGLGSTAYAVEYAEDGSELVKDSGSGAISDGSGADDGSDGSIDPGSGSATDPSADDGSVEDPSKDADLTSFDALLSDDFITYLVALYASMGWL